MSPDLAGPLGLMCGWLALVIFLTWDVGHRCHDPLCTRDKAKKGVSK